MAGLDIATELAGLDKASGLEEKHHGTVSKHAARLQAAVQIEVATQLTHVMQSLECALSGFSTASEIGTKELSLWTKRYSWAAWALVFATLVQIGISTVLILGR